MHTPMTSHIESRMARAIKVELPYPLLPSPGVVAVACIATALTRPARRDACKTILGGGRR